jgi:hypothetical protein
MKKTFAFMLLVALVVIPAGVLSASLRDRGAIGSKRQIAQNRQRTHSATSAKNRRSHSKISQVNPPTNLVGEWTNQLGSKLNIKAVDPNTGQITGTYKSPSGTGGNEFPLIGWVNYKPPIQDKDNAIVVSFSVRWGGIGSITTWAGYVKIVNSVPIITGQWFLVRPNSDYVWDHILTGQDVFKKS